MSRPTVGARGLRKAFGEVPALDGLSLAMPAGSMLGLLGPNGSGPPQTVAFGAVALLAVRTYARMGLTGRSQQWPSN